MRTSDLRERSRQVAAAVQRLRYKGTDDEARLDLESLQRFAAHLRDDLLVDDGPNHYEALLSLAASIDRPDHELARHVRCLHTYPHLLVAVFGRKICVGGA